MILIIASSDDSHADEVTKKIEKMSLNFHRIYPDRILEEDFKFVFSSAYEILSCIEISGIKIQRSEIRSVYCRDLNFIDCLESAPISVHLEYHERKSAIEGFLKSLKNIFWMNKPWEDDFIDNKI